MATQTRRVMASKISGGIGDRIGVGSSTHLSLNFEGVSLQRKSLTAGAIYKRKWRSRRLREFDARRFFLLRHKRRLKRRRAQVGVASEDWTEVQAVLDEGARWWEGLEWL